MLQIRIAGVGRLPLNAQERALWRSALSADGDENDAIGNDAISVLEKEIIPAAELRQLPLITK